MVSNLQQIWNQLYTRISYSKLLLNFCPGVYKLQCSCQSRYLGETKKKVSGAIEHQQDSLKWTLESSGASEYTLECHDNFNSLHPKTITRETNYKQRKIRKAQENSRKAKLHENIKLLNRVERNLVSTNKWTPLGVKIETDVARNQTKSLLRSNKPT